MIVVAHPRHRLHSVDQACFRPTVPRHYRPTSHRRTRGRLMQLSVAELVQGSRRAVRVPWWRVAGAFLVEWGMRVVEPGR